MKLLLPVSFILIAIGLFFGVINPIYSGDNGILKLRTDVATYNKALDNVKELQKTFDNLVNTYKNITDEDKNKLDHFLPNTANNIKFILEIENIANLHSMPIKNIKFQPQDALVKDVPAGTTKTPTTGGIVVNNSADARSYGTFPIEFTTEGDYDTFVALLKDIEHNLRLVDVKSVSFVVPPTPLKLGEGPNPNIYTYTLKVETYWLK